MDAETVTRLRRVVAKLSRVFNASATDAGLTPTQASTLALVASRGPLSLFALNELERLNPTMLSRVVGKLDRADLIQRRPDPADQRVVLVEATSAGRELSESIRAQRTRAVSTRVATLDPSEVRAITDALPALEALVTAFESPSGSVPRSLFRTRRADDTRRPSPSNPTQSGSKGSDSSKEARTDAKALTDSRQAMQ